MPSGYESKYPYDRSGKMAGGAEEFDLPDPLIWLAYVAAVTDADQARDRHPDPAAAQPADHGEGGRDASTR